MPDDLRALKAAKVNQQQFETVPTGGEIFISRDEFNANPKKYRDLARNQHVRVVVDDTDAPPGQFAKYKGTGFVSRVRASIEFPGPRGVRFRVEPRTAQERAKIRQRAARAGLYSKTNAGVFLRK